MSYRMARRFPVSKGEHPMAVPQSRSVWSRILDVASLAATPLAPSHYLELVSPLRATHTLNARVEAVHDEGDGTRTLTLRPGRGFRSHRAGQYVRVGAAINGRVVTRTFSISSSPDRRDGCIAITVKATPDGKLSRFLVHDVRPGAYLTIAQAQGSFVQPEGAPVRPLFVTAGSGITPVMSMIRTFVARGTMPDAVHVHYARTGETALFATELASVAAAHPRYRYVLVTTREGHGARARFDRAALDALVPDWQSREAWACGPQGMLDAVEACFAAAGRAQHLHLEAFHAKLAPRDAKATGGRVRFGLSRADVEANGQTSLLEVAEAAGIQAAHGCRMGICHSCDVTMVSGCVRDLRTGAEVNEPGIRVQICVHAAAGNVDLAL